MVELGLAVVVVGGVGLVLDEFDAGAVEVGGSAKRGVEGEATGGTDVEFEEERVRSTSPGCC